MPSEESPKESPDYNKIFRKGVELGIIQGVKLGLELSRIARTRVLLDREQEFLRVLLVEKFGVLPEPAEMKLRNASEADLERWRKRLFTAASIDDMLM